ncbi:MULTISPECIES: hypothetical protein [unclassified Streptomyces]|uniref:hypothetical protein n=1 Tax=unclassified Streptomyces TaxID=2593676 RepID=UPI003816D82A
MGSSAPRVRPVLWSLRNRRGQRCHRRVVTDQEDERQWILPDGRAAHVDGGPRDGWITEA